MEEVKLQLNEKISKTTKFIGRITKQFSLSIKYIMQELNIAPLHLWTVQLLSTGYTEKKKHKQDEKHSVKSASAHKNIYEN